MLDTLGQILAGLVPTTDCSSTTDLKTALQALEKAPRFVIADAFAYPEAERRRFCRAVVDRPSPLPLLLLLPADTCAYRDAAVQLGANGVVVTERVATDLIPALAQVLERFDLVQGAVARFTAFAQRSAPVGEAVYALTEEPYTLQALSQKTVERLAQSMTPGSQAPPSSHQVSGSVPERVFLRGMRVSADQEPAAPVETLYRSACNLNCGAHFCGLQITVRAGRLVNVAPADFPDRRYRRICLKGIGHLQRAAHPRRLTTPLKRRGARGADDWEAISWEQALDEITARLRRVMHTHGPQSAMFFTFSGQLSALNGFSGVYQRLAAGLGASATGLRYGLDSAVPSGVEDTLGEGAGYLANDYTDLPNARLILIWGADPVRTRLNWWPFFLEARKAGAHLVVIDPRYTATAAKSDEWLPIRPGTDLYLALGLLHYLLRSGDLDWEFVRNHTVAPLLVREDDGRFLRWPTNALAGRRQPSGITPTDCLVWDLAQEKPLHSAHAIEPALRGRFVVGGVACHPAFELLEQAVAPYSPEVVAAKTGLSVAQISRLADLYNRTKPARIYT
ncbi:MAG TPA: molybdopterin-dependent oxidoreductase, partial [Anaerolineales bacterium]|nr:molybdopterin-dependent oxidoreductase [Anaerolineales bacterium]